MSKKVVLREITYEQMSTLVTELKTNNFVKDKEIERLHSIIKEVREYVNTDKNCVPKHIKDYINNLLERGN